MKSIKKIVTHSGVFHADEVFASAALRLFHNNPPVERVLKTTPAMLEDTTVAVVDIGGQHDPTLLNFDHHQTVDGHQSAFGLVWDYLISQGVETLEVMSRVRDQLVVPIDLWDTGVTGPRIEIFTLSQAISSLNSHPSGEGFETAVRMAEDIISSSLAAATEWVEARGIVISAVPTSGVMFLDKFVPWQEHLASHPKGEDVLFVVFPSNRGGWNIQSVCKPGTRTPRLLLPVSWVADPPVGVTFCHQGRWIAACEGENIAVHYALKAAKGLG